MGQILQVAYLLRPYWRFIAQSLLVSIALMLLQIPGPYITKILIDDIFPNQDYALLSFSLILGAVMSIAVGGSQLLSGYFAQCIGMNIGYDYQSRFYQHIQTLDFSFFDARETGEILARFRDMYQALTNVIQIFNTLIMNVLQLLIFPPILFFINWHLALISIAVLPFDTLVAVLTGKYIKRLTEESAESTAALSAKNYESINGIRTVQALGLETVFYEKVRELFRRMGQVNISISLLQGNSNLLSSIFRAGGTLAYGWYGWNQVLDGHLSLGTYLAFSAYVGYLYGPISNLVGLISRVEVTLVHIGRFLEIFNLEPAVKERSDMPQLPVIRGEIEFHNICFSYDDKEPCLQRINLKIPAGTTIAVVGRSGSGKSTLCKLIPRFYDPQQGYISIDGHDIRNFRLQSLRRQIGFAMQGSTLFQGTIMENICGGKDRPLSQVENAARSANIHDLIGALPKGYYTVLGEEGVQLSQGQQQRIALARVLLMDNPILILDEPTAALDMESEYHIKETLNAIRHEKTIIVIAHRLSTIQGADKIVVLDAGRIVEYGSHDELIARAGSYANLHQLTASI